jgi:hypothetical protein
VWAVVVDANSDQMGSKSRDMSLKNICFATSSQFFFHFSLKISTYDSQCLLQKRSNVAPGVRVALNLIWRHIAL